MNCRRCRGRGVVPQYRQPRRCGRRFRAYDGLQLCGRPAGHAGSHTRDALPSERGAKHERDVVCPSCGGSGREPEPGGESLRDFRRRVIDPTRNRLQDS